MGSRLSSVRLHEGASGSREQSEIPSEAEVASACPVTSIQVASYVIPTDQPEADGTLSWSETAMVVVSAVAGGQAGLGWTYGSPAAQPLIAGMLAGIVEGREAMDVAGSYEAMCRAVRNVGREGIAATAISAVDIALWDLKARILNLSLTALIGRANNSVPVYGSGGFTSYDDLRLREQLTGWVNELGIPRAKIKIGESWGSRQGRDLERVALAREVVGPDAELYVDANGGYTTAQAVRVGKALADYGVSWFEEPVSSQDVAGLAAIRRQVLPDVAAGEYSWTLAGSARLLDADAVDCLQADVTRCGGITGFLQAAALAAAHNVQISGHCAPNLHAHVAGCVPNLRHVEYFHDHQRIEQLLFDGTLSPKGGVMTPDPDRAGLGMTVRTADAEAYRRG
jgi:L-alanine-DL-glutamate epimerase-like enolase superfamily enzyme